MAKNQSPYTVFVETEDGGTVAVGPDQDLPAGRRSTTRTCRVRRKPMR
jgi:hypothetical protein